MTLEIILSFVSIAVTTTGLGYMFVKWHSKRNNGAAVIGRYHADNETFFPTFLGLYSYLPQTMQKKFPKFILYYLAQKGYLSLRIESNGNVKVMRTGDAGELNASEQHLLNSIFQNSEEYFLSEDAIVGLESVNLNEIHQQYAQGMLTCPLGYNADETHVATLSNPGHTFVLDSEHMKSDQLAAVLVSLITGIAIIPALGIGIDSSDIFISIICTYLIYAVLLTPTIFAIRGLTKYKSKKGKTLLRGASKQVNDILNVLRLVLDILILLSFGNFALICTIFFVCSVAGITTLASLYCIAAIIAIWVVTAGKRKNKVTSYITAENDLYEFISYIKAKFKSVRRKMRKRSAKFYDSLEDMRDSSSELLPFASLFGKKKDVDALLLEEKTKLPNWLSTEQEMAFEQADQLIDSNLTNRPQPSQRV